MDWLLHRITLSAKDAVAQPVSKGGKGRGRGRGKVRPKGKGNLAELQTDVMTSVA